MIKGISDIRRFPRAGKIHLGEKRLSEKTGREYPTAVDYFVWPEEYAEELTRLFGERAREIIIMFPVDDRELVAPQWYKRYGASSGLVCRGDGETAICRTETGELAEIECPGRECEWYQQKHCRHVMNLQFVIPELVSEGVWQIDTSSYHSIVNFNSSWDYIRALTGGRIAMIPLRLRLVPKEVSPDGRKKVVHVLELRLAERMGLDRLRALASGTEPAKAAIPEPDISDEREYFYPREVRADKDDFDDLEPAPGFAEVDDLDGRIADLEAALGLTRAQMSLRWRKVGGDKAAMVELLEKEYGALRGGDGRNERQPSHAAAPETPDAPRRASRRQTSLL